MNHTPAPWAYDDEIGEVIATKCGYHPGGGPALVCVVHTLEGEQATNGRLLAASPDMYEALLDLLDGEGDWTVARLAKCRAALNKAEGK